MFSSKSIAFECEQMVFDVEVYQKYFTSSSKNQYDKNQELSKGIWLVEQLLLKKSYETDMIVIGLPFYIYFAVLRSSDGKCISYNLEIDHFKDHSILENHYCPSVVSFYCFQGEYLFAVNHI